MQGRIGADVVNAVNYLGEMGFYASAICRKIRRGLTVSMVYRICRESGLRLRDYRRGKGRVAQQVMRMTPSIGRVLRRA